MKLSLPVVNTRKCRHCRKLFLIKFSQEHKNYKQRYCSKTCSVRAQHKRGEIGFELKGEMSIVGPRAYYPDELREQQRKYPQTTDSVKVVLSVRPGLTGFWQVSGRSEINFDKRIQMDASYVSKRSIPYDLLIIAKTPWAMISGKGAL